MNNPVNFVDFVATIISLWYFYYSLINILVIQISGKDYKRSYQPLVFLLLLFYAVSTSCTWFERNCFACVLTLQSNRIVVQFDSDRVPLFWLDSIWVRWSVLWSEHLSHLLFWLRINRKVWRSGPNKDVVKASSSYAESSPSIWGS